MVLRTLALAALLAAASAPLRAETLAFGAGVPVHPGAEAAYRERGLLP
jgi:TRAP-type uncharacterized transport system substrate-binding protein